MASTGRAKVSGHDLELVAIWRQGAHDGISFSQTDFTEDLKKISVPVLVMHGDDDQIVPYADWRFPRSC